MPARSPSFLLIALVLLAGCMIPAPTDTPPATPAPGSVVVSSTPAGAEVYLDNEYRGATPVTVAAAAGSHTLGLRLRDHQAWEKIITVEAGGNAYVDAALVPLPAATTVTETAATSRPTTLPTTRAGPARTTTPTTVRTTRAILPANITGTHQGFTKDAPSSPPVPFTIQLMQQDTGLWGTIGEHEDLMRWTGTSRVAGTVNGNHVLFNVFHENTGTNVSATQYDGTYNPATREITGRWYIGISEGSFVITIA